MKSKFPKNFLLILIYILTTSIVSSNLVGCATVYLLESGTHDVKDEGKKTEVSEIYTSKGKMCISFKGVNDVDKAKRYLVVDPGDNNFNTKELSAIFKGPLDLRFKNINIEAQHHQTLKEDVHDHLIIDILYVIPDVPVKFIDPVKTADPYLSYSRIGQKYFINNSFLEVALRKQFKQKFNVDTVSFAQFQTLTWLKKGETEVDESNPVFNLSRGTEPYKFPKEYIDESEYNLVVNVYKNFGPNPLEPTTGMILDFDISKFAFFQGMSMTQTNINGERTIKVDYNNNTASLRFGSYRGGLPVPLKVRSMTIQDYCFEPKSEFVLLMDLTNIPSQLTFSNINEKRDIPLLLKVMGTPFTLAFDVITSPVQILAFLIFPPAP